MPLSAPFGHLWLVGEGLAVSIEAHLLQGDRLSGES